MILEKKKIKVISKSLMAAQKHTKKLLGEIFCINY